MSEFVQEKKASESSQRVGKGKSEKKMRLFHHHQSAVPYYDYFHFLLELHHTTI